MKIHAFSVFLLLASFLFTACEQEELIQVDDRLKPYFERFQQEALNRDFNLDFEDTEGKIEELAGVGGQCVHNTQLPDVVLIDLVFWTQADDFDKEFIVFHELGHCILNRGHLDSKNDDNSCVSIMHSGTAGCGFVYNEETREEYLDELFFR